MRFRAVLTAAIRNEPENFGQIAAFTNGDRVLQLLHELRAGVVRMK